MEFQFSTTNDKTLEHIFCTDIPVVAHCVGSCDERMLRSGDKQP